MNPLYLILAIIFGLAFIVLLIYAFSRRSNVQTQNNGNNNQQPTGSNNQPVQSLCDGPIPLKASVHVDTQDIPINLWISACNPQRLVRNLLIVLAAAILLGMTLLFVYLATKSSDNIKPANTEQVQNQPATVNPPVLNPPLDPKIIIDPVNSKIDQSTQFLGGKIDSVNKNLTAHRESSKRGYVAQNKKLDDIKAGVDGNGTLLTDIQTRVAIIQNQIQLLLPKIDDTRTQYEAAIKSGNEELKTYWRAELINLNDKFEELLNKKEKAKSGDPD